MIRRPSKQAKENSHIVKYQNCPAKTFINTDGEITLGRTVFEHCQIVGEVAKELIKRSFVQHLFPKGSAFAAGAHDIGKVSPTFYNKLYNACGLPLLENINFKIEKQWGGHAGVSQITAQALNAPEYVPEVLGQHHGFMPNIASRRAEDEVFGGRPWHLERKKLVVALEESLQESWPVIEDFATARLLAGLTSVADWIGSGQHFDNPAHDWETKISQALDEAGFIQPEYKQNLSFQQIFGFPPRDAQSLLYEQVNQPGDPYH